MNLQFGSGVLYGIPNAGNLAANPTPQKFGILQEFSLEFKGDLKKLFGQNQFPVAKARGKIDVTGKGKIATLDPNLLNQLYFGQTKSTGVQRIVPDESHAPSTSVAPSNATAAVAGTVVTDYGVINKDTGLNMEKIASGTPAVGQYKFTPATTGGSPTAAAWVFNASETASAVLLTYLYPDTSGVTITLSNRSMGYAPEFRALLTNNFRGKYFGVDLYSCVMGMVGIPTKQEDFWICDIDLDASTDATDTLGAIYADV
jgi:hypothetical protein